MASLTVYATTSSGFLYKTGGTSYLTQQEAGDANLASATLLYIGQKYEEGGIWKIWRSGLFFDTSALPDDAVISAAVLSIYGYTPGGDYSDTDFDITVVSGADLADPLVVGDYGDLLNDTTSMGTVNTSGFSESGYNNITLNSTGRDAISKTSTTKFALRSSRDITPTDPKLDTTDAREYVKAYGGSDEGYEAKLVITYTTSPTVTTQTCQDVVGTTATGRGNITALGDSVTQHGHCWAETADPTTALSTKTTNGAASATGTFISAITGLTAGTGYYTRAYATNSIGTSYGANVYFIASLERAGYIWMESSNLRGFDENAVERQYIHTADVDDTASDGATTDPISSNWAYDHAASTSAHPALLITSEVAQAFKAEYNITTNDLATYVHGVKVELTRAADIQPSNGCWFGGQFVLNCGTDTYTDLDKPAYVLQAIFKGNDVTPNGVDIHVGRFETQSAGKVSDIVHILANTGTTITGSLEYIATHVAPSVSMVNLNAQSSVTVPIGIKIMSGTGSSYNYGIDLASATINTADIKLHHGHTILDGASTITLDTALAMGNNKITGVTDPTSAQDAATKTYVDTQVATANEFTELTDTPANYTDDGLKLVRVNTGETALEFMAQSGIDHGSIGGLGDDDHTQYLLADGTRALAGAWDMNNQNLTNVDIDSGAIDGTNITVGSGKTLDVSSGTLTLTNDQISGDKIQGGTIGSTTITTLTTGAGNAVFNSWGAVFGDAYYLYMRSDYSAYVASIDSGYLDISGNTGLRMRVSDVGVIFSITKDALSIYPPTTFSQGIIILPEAEFKLRLPVTDTVGTIEGEVWYDASENTIKVVTGSVDSVVLLTATQTLTNKTLDAVTLIGKLTAGANEMEGSAFDINGGTIDGVTIGGAAAPTVTNLGTVTTCNIDGGTIAGVTVDGDLTWSSAQSGLTLTAPTLNGTVTLGSTPVFSVGAGDAQILTTGAIHGLSIESTANSTAGAMLKFIHDDSTPVDNSYIAYILAYGDNDAHEEIQMYQMRVKVTDVSDGTENSQLDCYLMNAGTWNLARTLSGAGNLWIDGSITLDANETVDGIDVSAHDIATTGVHGAGANTILYSDHAALTTAHGAVSAATASKIVVRDAEGQAKFAAPAASGDALIKGTRVTTAELPAMTDEYYWVGTGTDVEERAVPSGGATIATGSYVGNEISHQEAVGFKCSMVIISYLAKRWVLIPGATVLDWDASPYHQNKVAGIYLHASDGFQVGTDAQAANSDGVTHYYWAISE